jgi:hypothetical protein
MSKGRYSLEVCERAVRMYFDHRPECCVVVNTKGSTAT